MNEFCDAIIALPDVNQVRFTYKIADMGCVDVYLRNSNTSESYNGGVLSIDDFEKLVKWVNEDQRLIGRMITFYGNMSDDKHKTP